MTILFATGLWTACTAPPPPDAGWFEDRQATAQGVPPPPYDTVCADGATIPGIDVSYWQPNVDWGRVASDGIRFAFMRVSYGLQVYDTEFQDNWSGTREEGIVRGAYQYFLAGDDAEDQDWLLLDEMGPLRDGDLPPVLDVESYGNEGISTTQMTNGIQRWMDVVEGEIGREPIIYTSAYLWSELTGDADFGDHPLWTANWEVSCPLVPNPWDDWVFWQTSATGSVSGISGDVDTNLYNGSLAALSDWAIGEDTDTEETCTGPCTVAATGRTVIEEDDGCGCLTGSPSEIHTTSGHDDHAWWTEADVPEPDYAEGINTLLDFQAAGTYEVHAWVPQRDDLTSGALYKVFHGDSSTKVALDQRANGGGWASLGTFDFAAGEDQWVRLGDTWTDSADAGRTVMFDALRFDEVSDTTDDTGDTWVDTAIDTGLDCECDEADFVQRMVCTDGGVRERECDGCDWTDWSPCEGGEEDESTQLGCGCATGRRGGAGWTLWAVLLLGYSTRRHTAQASPGRAKLSAW